MCEVQLTLVQLMGFSCRCAPMSLPCPGTPSGPVSVGCLAGDAQSYILFCDFFDRVIEGYHGYKIASSSQESDFNYDNLKVRLKI